MPKTHHRRVVLANDGGRDLEVEVKAGAERPWLRFEPASVSLPAKRKARLDFHLDSSRLPDSFRSERVPFRLVLDGDPETSKTLWVTAKAGPKPRAEPVRFGELQEGTVQHQQIVLRNGGGIPCALERIEVKGKPQLTADSSRLPLRLSPDGSVRIPVSWDTRASDEAIPDAGFRLFFSHGQDLFVPAEASLYRYRLEAEPGRLRLEGTTKRVAPQTIVLRNLGTIDVEIAGIGTSDPWLETTTAPTPRRLKAPSESENPEETSLGILVRCRAEGLEPGTHQGELLVKTRDPELDNLAIPVELLVQPLETYHDYIGIDFGTTSSVVV
ncbi:MAG: cupredoxin domain-containing protein, partial [Holophagales bacterium]|nr:cupredoxin domain-containing protein [Holophagales bacterium]